MQRLPTLTPSLLPLSYHLTLLLRLLSLPLLPQPATLRVEVQNRSHLNLLAILTHLTKTKIRILLRNLLRLPGLALPEN